MKKAYINGIGCISAQNPEGFLEDPIVHTSEDILPLKFPAYKEFIPPAAIRRMAKGVKNGIVGSALAMKEAGIDKLDAIITGTGLGCIEDSESFLKGILDNNEQFLTPTSFIQSTHNTVGAQIALGLKCNAYNFTYVNGSVSFESALLDAKMQIDSGEASNILVGGIDEMADFTLGLYKLAGFLKTGDGPHKLLDSDTTGAVYGEGATFFVIQSEKTKSTYAAVADITITNKLDAAEVPLRAIEFVKSNGLSIDEIDAVVLGFNGERDYDHYYRALTDGVFADSPQVYYKHLSGEYNTASAFGLWAGAKIIRMQNIPDVISVNRIKRSRYRKVLLYNQYRGTDHSFTLITQD
ncbi:MAG: 3-oxoacyl-ACP synthase [Flavobacterium sp.]|nr:MAG: 3-oxoacyl-ACP synthase [Flavobacterium sp.]